MNGQPALINIGKQISYIKKVTETINATTGVATYSIDVGSQSSGLVMSVVPTILENQDIVLNLIPVTSKLTEPIATVSFGGALVGLPTTSVRELSTLVKIKQGEMLVVGGLIDSSDDDNDTDVPLMGKLPLIGGLFSLERKINTRRELVILLKPEIIS
jgi:general secretion pathway protein D/MSHA biogenesis protein MshL